MQKWLALAVVLVGCKHHTEAPHSAVANGSLPPTRADAAAAPAPIDPDRFLDEETIGPIKRGMSEAELKQVLGKPMETSDVQEEPATGDFVTAWSWDGVRVFMVADGKRGPFKVNAIHVTKPPFATSRGIKVGSTLAEISAAYPRSSGYTDERGYLVGSAYGGLLFTLKKRVVTDMFL